MINIAAHFGQAASKLSGQERGSLKSLLTELQGLRVSHVTGSAAGSGGLVPVVTVDADYDSLLAVFSINNVGGSGGSLTHVPITSGSCVLVSGSANNFYHKEDMSDKDLMVFWFDCDNG